MRNLNRIILDHSISLDFKIIMNSILIPKFKMHKCKHDPKPSARLDTLLKERTLKIRRLEPRKPQRRTHNMTIAWKKRKYL